jgi:hypothetical protein
MSYSTFVTAFRSHYLALEVSRPVHCFFVAVEIAAFAQANRISYARARAYFQGMEFDGHIRLIAVLGGVDTMFEWV